MRYHTEKPESYASRYGFTYICNHPVYDRCTLYLIETKGLAVIQQHYDPITKRTWWSEIDSWLTDLIYSHSRFMEYFNQRAKEPLGEIYPTVTIRQIMWALKMKPLKRERWETSFDRRDI